MNTEKAPPTAPCACDCYVAKSREQLLADLKDESTILRWTPVALVRSHPAIGAERKDNQRCLMMGDKLIDDDTDEGVDTWFIIHGMLEDGLLEEVDHPAEPYSVCEYVAT